MRIGRARGSQRTVDKLVRQIEEIDLAAAAKRAEDHARQATEHRPGAVYLPADAPGEVVATRPEADKAPSIGWQRAVCVDVHDLGLQDSKFGPRHQVEFAWELEERREEDGRRFCVWRRFTLSLSDTSTLRKFLTVWQGYHFAPHELRQGVPLASRFIGRDCQLLIEAQVNPETGKTYRNVRAAYPLPVKAPRVVPEGTYIRKVWRRRKEDRSADGADVREGCGAGEAVGVARDAGPLGPDVAPGAAVPEGVSGGADDAPGVGETGAAEGGGEVGDGAVAEAPGHRTGALHEAFRRYRVAKGGRL